jgi:uncharacterized protein YggE
MGSAERKGITVRGSATVEVAPDYAECTITSRARASTAGAALEGLNARCATCDRLLDASHEAVLNRMTAALKVEPVIEYDPTTGEQKSRGYTAWRALRVRLLHTEAAAQLLGDLVRDATAELGGPFWMIDSCNPAHDQVRIDASVDARRRADAYAAGLGVSVGEVLWASEPMSTSETPLFARCDERRAERGGGGRAQRRPSSRERRGDGVLSHPHGRRPDISRRDSRRCVRLSSGGFLSSASRGNIPVA